MAMPHYSKPPHRPRPLPPCNCARPRASAAQGEKGLAAPRPLSLRPAVGRAAARDRPPPTHGCRSVGLGPRPSALQRPALHQSRCDRDRRPPPDSSDAECNISTDSHSIRVTRCDRDQRAERGGRPAALTRQHPPPHDSPRRPTAAHFPRVSRPCGLQTQPRIHKVQTGRRARAKAAGQGTVRGATKWPN